MLGGKNNVKRETAVKQACVLITVLNKNSVSIDLRVKEWDFALQYDIFIIPIYNVHNYNKDSLEGIIGQIVALGSPYKAVTQ